MAKSKHRGLGNVDIGRCTAETISVRRVRLNSGGYNEDGRYFGRGEPLFFYHGSDSGTSNFGYLRAANRNAAKSELRAKCPSFKFKR